MNREELIALADKILNGEASEAEVGQYNAWYNAMQQREDFDIPEPELKRDAIYARVERIMDSRDHVIEIKKRKLWPRIAAVAAAVTAIALWIYFFNASRLSLKNQDLMNYVKNDIAPGKNGATITLADGKVIQLSGEKSGVVIGEELRYSDGTVVRYSSGSRSAGPASPGQRSTGPVGVHSLSPSELNGADSRVQGAVEGLQGADGKVQNLIASTSKGQTYQFTLPDGTKVWLNADSKIEFPSDFVNSKTRNVKLTGEAYFAVVHRAKQPFRVESGGPGGKQIVEDIGTEFNINAYPDEQGIRTTLLEGSASVSSLREGSALASSLGEARQELNASEGMARVKATILAPRQQAVWINGAIKVNSANVEEVISWKNGYFRFNDEKLGSIMKKLGRWYGIEVVFSDNAIAGIGFTGTISRSKNINQVLSMLEKTKGVHFKIEGRRLIVNE
jgi:transmembrane sensor